MQTDYKNILIIKPSALGDIAMALPVATTLRAAFPKAKISWLVRPEFAPLLMHVDQIDDIVLFNRTFLSRWWRDRQALRGLRRFLRELREADYDLVLDLQGLFRSGLFAWATRCPRRYGLANAREGAWLFYTHRVQPGDSVHVLDQYLKVAAAAGAEQPRFEAGLTADPQSLQAVHKMLASHDLKPGGFVALAVGSARPHKCWPVDRFADLAGHIRREYGLAVAVVGSKGEMDRAEELLQSAHVPVVNLVGRTNLSNLLSVLDSAALTIANDTGPAYMAAALGRPVVILFGPTNPRRLRPNGQTHAVAAVNPDRPDGAINHLGAEYAMDRLPVELVMEQVRRQFHENGVVPFAEGSGQLG